MTSVEWHFAGLATATLFVAFYGMQRYRTLINPLTIFAVTDIGLFTIFSGVLANSITEISGDNIADGIVKTVRISLFYVGATTLPFLFRGPLPSKLFGQGLSLLGLASDSVARHFSPIKLGVLLVGAAISFLALAYFGGGGMLWITNARVAYENYRSGAGPFFVFTQWLLTFAMLYYIWAVKPRALKLCLVILFFCLTVYSLGSKNYILTMLVIGVVYYNFYIKQISFIRLLVITFLIFSAVLGLLIIQGSYPSVLESIFYFKDYFNTTAQFISRFEEFGFRYGQGWLSSFWFYVPRGLYPDKPYEYGIILIHQILFPDAAAIGYTPGILPWSLAYLDFGLFGVVFYGLLSGIWQRMAYEYFLKNKQKYFAFVLAVQFCVWPVWTFATLIFVILWSIGQSLFLRIEWRDIRHTVPDCRGTFPADTGRKC